MGWVGNGDGCQRGFLQDVMVKENTNEKGKEGKVNLSRGYSTIKGENHMIHAYKLI